MGTYRKLYNFSAVNPLNLQPKLRFMVDREYIEKNIDIIFDFEKENIKSNNLFHYVQTFREISCNKKDTSGPIKYPSGQRPLMDLQLYPDDNWKLEWDTYTYLKKFYNKIEHLPGGQKHILKQSRKKVVKFSFYCCSY